MFEQLVDLPSGALVETVALTHRQESMVIAQRMAAVAALLRQRVNAAERVDKQREYAVVDPFDQTAAEVAAAMNLSPAAACYVVTYAETLDTRLPKIAALLAEGRTDWRTVRLIISRTGLIIDEVLAAKLDATLSAQIANWLCWSRQRIVNAVDAVVATLDPDAAHEPDAPDDKDRYIEITPDGKGMAEVYGTVGLAAATALDRRLTHLAARVCQNDPRTPDQRRADALGALALGRRLSCRCGLSDCPNRAAETTDDAANGGGAKVVINVVASEDTVTGTGSRPGYLEGFGVISAPEVRALVDDAFLFVVDPVARAADALRYQPSAALERAVRCRDLTCRFPGCSRQASYCDLDHTIPFNRQHPAAGGPTTLENLKCLCRHHHRLKTFGGWRDRQLADGTVIWTAPTGHTYRTVPAGVDLFPALGRLACATPNPNTRTRAQQRAGRIAAARKHNREQRPINERRRWLQQARKEEIEARKFRNHMRSMLFAFKGTPSTSPFSPWVNDPREPEELPPDWAPADAPAEPLPQRPPF
jgi:hypothetical protein